ncbi:MAG: FeS assembly SUF system protein [Proteobacteria bacterium]|nr:MAG: FeS assembly SUF system protein [Pseudomonadota bacterium]
MFKLSRLNQAEKVAEFDDDNVTRRAWLKDEIIQAIKQVYDPEIPVNVYDMGLIYSLELDTNNNVLIEMTLTSPACPVAGSLPGMVEAAARSREEVNNVTVELVWDPPWDISRMSEDARLQLNMF